MLAMCGRDQRGWYTGLVWADGGGRVCPVREGGAQGTAGPSAVVCGRSDHTEVTGLVALVACSSCPTWRVWSTGFLNGQPLSLSLSFFKYLFIYSFIYLAAPHLSCGMLDLRCGVRDLAP